MSSVEACWTVRFGDPRAGARELNGGVIVLESGRLYGGDSGYAYLGLYDVSGERIDGSIHVVRHDPDIISIYDRDEDEFDLRFRMVRQGDEAMEGELIRSGYPNGRVILRRLANLP